MNSREFLEIGKRVREPHQMIDRARGMMVVGLVGVVSGIGINGLVERSTERESFARRVGKGTAIAFSLASIAAIIGGIDGEQFARQALQARKSVDTGRCHFIRRTYLDLLRKGANI